MRQGRGSYSVLDILITLGYGDRVKEERHNPPLKVVTVRTIHLGKVEDLAAMTATRQHLSETGVLPDSSLGIMFIRTGTLVDQITTTHADDGTARAGCIHPDIPWLGFVCDAAAVKQAHIEIINRPSSAPPSNSVFLMQMHKGKPYIYAAPSGLLLGPLFDYETAMIFLEELRSGTTEPGEHLWHVDDSLDWKAGS